MDMTSTLMYTDDTQSETTAKEGIRNLIKEKYENEGLEMPQPVYKEPISPRPQQVSISIYLPDRILLPIMSIVFTHEGNSHPVV